MNLTQDFYSLYRKVRNHKKFILPDRQNNKVEITRNEILNFNDHQRYANVIDIVQYYKNRCSAHLLVDDYPILYAASKKLIDITDKNDIVIFLGRSPGPLYLLFNLMISNNTEDSLHRNAIQVDFSGSPNPRVDSDFFDKKLLQPEQFTIFHQKITNDIIELELPGELISTRWMVHYYVTRKIVTPQKLKFFSRNIKNIGLNFKNINGKRIIIVDRIMSAAGVRFFASILYKEILKEQNINDLYLINIQKENSPDTNLFYFKKCMYPEDYIKFLGHLDIPFNLAQRLDDATSAESMFTYFPPYYWSEKYLYRKKLKPNNTAINISSSLVEYCAKIDNTIKNNFYKFENFKNQKLNSQYS